MTYRHFLLIGLALILAVGVLYVLWPRSGQALDLAASDKHIDRIIIEKSARTLTLLRQEKVVKTYSVRLGFAPNGQKTQEGDGKTPEGVYRINRRNGRSKFHLSLGLDYPLPAQQAAAKAKGVNPGGDIFIHGQPNWMAKLPPLTTDWTDGCIALTNAEIAEIWQLTPIGTQVIIHP